MSECFRGMKNQLSGGHLTVKLHKKRYKRQPGVLEEL